MCGVCGFWAATSFDQDVARGRLEAMSSAIAHRGPDGSDWFYDRPAGLGLAHRRLAIIDLSESGRQPMTSASGRFTICFNGEIFNYEAIRAELASAGRAPKWRGHSDTEVLLAAVEAWGLPAALERCVGMFAFALWDGRDRTLALVRDRLGIKPMYWALTPQGLCFGSELKALRAWPSFSDEIDRGVLSGYLAAYCIAAPRTIYRAAAKLEPGTIAVFKSAASGPKLSAFWSAAEVARAGVAHPFEGTEAEAIDELDRLLREVVGLRMISDVPLGAFLSGGIDSSTVVAAMQAQSSKPVHTFSIENENRAYDEGEASRAVAKHLGTHHTPLTVTAQDCLAVIPKLPTIYDEPFADSSQIPTFLVSQLARRNVTVSLSGDGGDELFGGYNRHVWVPRVWRLERRVPVGVRRVVARSMRRIRPAAIDRAFAVGEGVLPALRVPGHKFHKLASVLAVSSADEMHQTLASHWLPSDGALVDPVAQPERLKEAPVDGVAERMMYRDLVSYLPDDILTKVDRASMAVSLEARVPLLDHRLVAFAWRLPISLKVRGTTGKWILRKVLERYVPAELVSGPKMGFGVPMGDWLRGPLRPWAEELLEPGRLRREGFFQPEVIHRYWGELTTGARPWEDRLWDVLMFQAWLDANRPRAG